MRRTRQPRRRTEASRWVRLYRIYLDKNHSIDYVEDEFEKARLVVKVMEILGRSCRVTSDNSGIIFRGRR